MSNCVTEFCRSVLVLILYLGFHLLSFAVTTSLCIGLALLLVFTIEVWFNILGGKSYQVPQHIALGLTIVFLYDAVHVTISVATLSIRFQTMLESLRKEFPFMLIAVPWTLYAVLILGSFSQLYWQYEITHTSLSNTSWSNNSNGSLDSANKLVGNNSTKNMNETEAVFEGPDYRNNVTIFVFALAALVFCSAKIIQTDLIEKFSDLPEEHEMEFSVGTFSLLLCQVILTAGYSVPLINCIILVGLFDCSRGCTFLQVNVIAILTGVCGGYVESRSPFPVQGEPPYYCFENQARARSFLLQLMLLPLIPYSFFDSSSTQEYDQGYPAFVQYTIVISLTVLHTTKILSTTYILNERRRERHMEHLEGVRTWYINNFMNRINPARNAAVVPANAVVDVPQELQPDINGNSVNVEEATTLEQNLSQNSEEVAVQTSDRIVKSSNSSDSDNSNNNNSPSETRQDVSSESSPSTQSREELLVPYPSRISAQF